MYGDSLHKLEQIVVKALIKAPFKNNYIPQRRLVQSEKNYFGPLDLLTDSSLLSCSQRAAYCSHSQAAGVVCPPCKL